MLFRRLPYVFRSTRSETLDMKRDKKKRTRERNVYAILNNPENVIYALAASMIIRDRVRARFVLADNAGPTIEGNIIGRDEELNLVVDRAVELDILGRTSELGRIMLAGEAYSTFSVLFATEHQNAQPELDVFTHDRTNSAHQSPATERAAADDHGIAETSASNNITIGIWQVQFPKEWIEYESEIQSIIEQQYQNGEEVARFRQCRSRKKDIWYDYRISFRSMAQFNETSGRVRRVRRIERNAFALDMATASNECGVWAEEDENRS